MIKLTVDSLSVIAVGQNKFYTVVRLCLYQSCNQASTQAFPSAYWLSTLQFCRQLFLQWHLVSDSMGDARSAPCGPRELYNRACPVSMPQVVRGDQTWLFVYSRLQHFCVPLNLHSVFAFVVLDLVSSVLGKRFARKNVSDMTYISCRLGRKTLTQSESQSRQI